MEELASINVSEEEEEEEMKETKTVRVVRLGATTENRKTRRRCFNPKQQQPSRWDEKRKTEKLRKSSQKIKSTPD